jgi:hypothetical protein
MVLNMTGLSVQIVSLNRTWFVPRHSRNARSAERSLIRKTTPESLEELHSKKEPVAVSATPEDRPLTASPQGVMRMRIGVENKECWRGTGLETTFSYNRCTSYRSWVIPTVQRNQNWASRHSYSKNATCQSPGFACNQFYRRPMHCKEVVSCACHNLRFI